MKKILLIVDDSMLSIHMLTNILSDTYIIISAMSGEAAIESMKQQKPDIVLLDVVMPGMDGFDVLRFMRKHNELAGIPVIFITGESNYTAEETGLALGAVDYIKKPYNADIVRVRIHNHLEINSYKNNLEQLVQERTEQLDASLEAIITSMSLISESRDKVTGEHIQRIKGFTRIISRKIMELHPEALQPRYAEQTILFSTLHDVGKIGISDSILKKDKVLTPGEINIMKSHTIAGAELLRKAEFLLKHSSESEGLKVAIEIAEHHHERFDGTGYPHGLKGEAIPLSARIVFLADVYDTLRCPEACEQVFTHNEAVRVIIEGSSQISPSHFDPIVLEAFELSHHEFEKYY